MKDIEKRLKDQGITPTPIRKLVYRCLLDSSSPLSLSDIEVKLESVDKSTISRTLNLFRNHHLLHFFNDGSGSVKYELCTHSGEEVDKDQHVHFHCEECGKTICIKEVVVPEVKLPEGFLSNEKSFVITGICNTCNRQMSLK